MTGSDRSNVATCFFHNIGTGTPDSALDGKWCKSNKELSSKLSIVESTVEKHLEKNYEKLEISVRAKAVIWGIENCMDFPY